MPARFSDLIGMYFRKSPISKIREALKKCEAAGIGVTMQDLETHYLCGKDPMILADALVTAKRLNIETTFREVSTICLAGHDPMKLLPEASKIHVAKFDTFSPTRADRIIGFTRDQQQVAATITITYALTLSQLAFEFNSRHVHERMGAMVSVFINTSPDMKTLQLRKTSHEAELTTLVLEMLKGLKFLAIEYR